jgi:hypothetical protein
MTYVKVSLASTTQAVVALGKFLEELEKQRPRYLGDIRVARSADDGIIYVEAEYSDEEASMLVNERMAEVSTNILIDTGIYIVLAPGVKEHTA